MRINHVKLGQLVNFYKNARIKIYKQWYNYDKVEKYNDSNWLKLCKIKLTNDPTLGEQVLFVLYHDMTYHDQQLVLSGIFL